MQAVHSADCLLRPACPAGAGTDGMQAAYKTERISELLAIADDVCIIAHTASARLIHLGCFSVSGDLGKMKDASFTIAEGCFYQLRISFYVQREIVTGLKYIQQSYRAGIRGT